MVWSVACLGTITHKRREEHIIHLFNSKLVWRQTDLAGFAVSISSPLLLYKIMEHSVAYHVCNKRMQNKCSMSESVSLFCAHHHHDPNTAVGFRIIQIQLCLCCEFLILSKSHFTRKIVTKITRLQINFWRWAIIVNFHRHHTSPNSYHLILYKVQFSFVALFALLRWEK